MTTDRNGDAESRAALDRVARESEALGTSALARMGRHFAGADAPGARSDPAEVWGRRVGRALSLALGVALTWTLGRQLGWW